MKKYCLVCVFAVFGLLALPAMAQNGTLSGTITAAGGTPVPNAVIILTNTSTGATQRIATGADGTFKIPVPPGTYKVDVENAGYKRSSAENIQIVSGGTATITASLEVGPATEVVQITGDAIDTQDETATVGESFGTHPVNSIPVYSRNYQELNGLMPGVTPPQSDYSIIMDPQRTLQYHTNGLPAYTNDYLTAGDSIREPFTGTIPARIVPDTDIEQLNISTASYPASTGFASGAVTNVSPRPGTNGLHGSMFGFFSDQFLQARDALGTGPLASPDYRHWQAGTSLGAPLVHNKLFLFGSYQASLNSGSSVALGSVPTDAMLSGNFSGLGTTIYPATGFVGPGTPGFAGNRIPASAISPISSAILGALPAPNLPGFGNNLLADIPYVDNAHYADGRADYHFSNNVTGFLQYGYSYVGATQGSIFGPEVGGTNYSGLRNDHASASLAMHAGPITAESRFSYIRYRDALANTESGPLGAELSGLGFASTLPTLNVAGLGVLGTPANFPAKMIDNDYEGTEDAHYNHGIHQVDFGVQVDALQANGWMNSPLSPGGTFYFGPGATSSPYASSIGANAYANSLASFLMGAPSAAGYFNYATAPTYRQMLYAAYLGDRIRLTPHLTIELQGRYDVFSPTTTAHSGEALQYLVNSNTVTYARNDHYDLNNVSPRVGIAYSPARRTVFRASYALTYFRVPFELQGINFAGAGVQQGLAYGSYTTVPFSLTSLPSVTAPAEGGTAPNIPLYLPLGPQISPYVQNYYFQFQQGMTHGLVLKAGYFGNGGRHLPYFQELNVAAPGTGVSGLPIAGTAGVIGTGNGLTSNYNALQVNLTKRFSDGAGFTAAYTWSKALDYGTYLMNPFNLASNYGPANWDRTQMLNISHVFAIPIGPGHSLFNSGVMANIFGGWQYNGMFTWATGTPYSVTADALACGCAGLASIPGSFAGSNTGINGQASFNPALFATPAAGTIGTLGRNSFRGPDMGVYNASLFKNFEIRERTKLELRGEIYNVANSANYANPVANLASPGFGQIGGLIPGYMPRTFLTGVRIVF